MIKIKKKKKDNWLNKSHRFINNWKTLIKLPEFKWSFIKYFWQLIIVNNYDVIRINNNATTICLLFIKKFKSENYIDIQKIIIHKKTTLTTPVLQKIKKKLEEYRVLGYTTAEATFPVYCKELLKLYIDELGFEENKSKIIQNILRNNKYTTTVLKYLSNE